MPRLSRVSVLAILSLAFLALPALAIEGPAVTEVSVELDRAQEAEPVGRTAPPDAPIESGIPDPVAQSEDVCNLEEGEFYWLCHGWCHDGDRCAKKCSWATHDCCEHILYCVDPNILCFH